MHDTQPRARRSWLIAGFMFLFLACSGGSCTSCTACEGCGVTPIPGGFPNDARISNAAQVRLTSSGISFIEDNIEPIISTFMEGGLSFPIPRVDTTFDVPVVGSTEVGVCRSEDCGVEATIRGFELDPEVPNRMRANIQVVLDTRDAAGERRALPIRLRGGCSFLGCVINTTCQADIDSRNGSRDYIGLVAELDFVEETRGARAGYTRVVVNSVDLADGEGIEDDDVSFGSCSGVSGFLINLVSGLLKGTIVDSLVDQISTLLQSTVDEQLCQTRGELGCPTGTFAVPDESPESVCRFEASAESDCVPILLGTDGQGDIGASTIGSFSPGTRAPIQFLLASGGAGEAVNEGMSLFMYGGFLSTSRDFSTSPAHNPCVPMIEPPPLPEIPRVDTFRGNTLPFSMVETHVGIGLSEQFLNYSAYGAFDSGMLCIGTGTRLSQQLSSGLFSLLVRSLNNLVFPEPSAPIAIAVRPQTPPTVDIGAGTADDPLLTIAMTNLDIDFYVWSTERYVRFMTYRTDLTVPVNLTVEAGQIVPMLGDLTPTNSSVLNSELLNEDPDTLAMLLEDLIGSFAGMLTSGISPIDLPAIMGFNLEVPEGGIIGFDQGGDSFLGIFANLALAGPAPFTAQVDTELDIADLRIQPEALQVETWGQGGAPSLMAYLDAQGGPAGSTYEYSWRINQMPWSDWTTDRHIRIQDRALLFQARHNLEARARVAGQAATVDTTPARVPVVIDVLEPSLRLVQGEDHRVQIEAFDVVSDREALQLRWRADRGAWSAWSDLSANQTLPLLLEASRVEVEVRDEAGNVGSASQALIRGLPRPGASGGCDCAVAPAQEDSSSSGLWLGLALLGLIGWRRSRRSPKPSSKRAARASLPFAGLLLIGLLSGCNCAGNPGVDAAMPAPCNDMCTASMPAGSLCCPETQMCVDYNLGDFCEPGFRCASAEALAIDESCTVTCQDCMPLPDLDRGLLATHLDAARAADGSLVLSGYSPGAPTNTPYGDLVIGIQSGEFFDWEIVDGAPDGPITGGVMGWRGGVAAPGDDVGRWTSIVTSGDTVMVSYYDATNSALKLATRSAGVWQTETVDDLGDTGRYSSLALDSSGEPVIAYQVIESATAVPGRPSSRVRVASRSGGVWSSADIHVVEMGCRPGLCPDGASCLESGECVMPTADCGECADGEVCAAGTCSAALPDGYVEDLLPATGLYNELVSTPTGLALAWYDRTAGNVLAASYDGAWSESFLIDGYGAMNEDIGDCGQGLSLAVDSVGVWHLSYIDGTQETLRYANVVDRLVSTSVIDDGATDGTTAHADGRHIVGDDSSIGVTTSGEVRVAYQDATSQRAMLARQSAEGTWTVSVLDGSDHSGFWLVHLVDGERSDVATWWRNQADGMNDNGVRTFTIE